MSAKKRTKATTVADKQSPLILLMNYFDGNNGQGRF